MEVGIQSRGERKCSAISIVMSRALSPFKPGFLPCAVAEEGGAKGKGLQE